MCPCTYARRPTDAHTSSRTHPRTHTYIHPYTHVRTYTRTRRKFSDTKSALQHYQTEFHHQSDSNHFYYPITVQSVSILAPPSIHYLYKASESVIIYYTLSSIRNHLPTIYQPSDIYLLLISHSLSLPTIILHLFHLYPISSLITHHPINMSVCYKTLSILYILVALSSMRVSHLSSPYLFTIIIFIMETVFRANRQ